jgi:hypothetical protein
VVLDNGRVHYFENYQLQSRDLELSGSFTIKGHKIQSITSGYNHSIMVTTRGVVFGFGYYDNHQLGVVDPSTQWGDIVSTPTEVFVGVTKFNGVAKLPNDKELHWPGAYQSWCKWRWKRSRRASCVLPMRRHRDPWLAHKILVFHF